MERLIDWDVGNFERGAASLVHRFRDWWVWCERCGEAALKCPWCGNTDCNGGGCDECLEAFGAIQALDAYDRPTFWEVEEMKKCPK